MLVVAVAAGLFYFLYILKSSNEISIKPASTSSQSSSPSSSSLSSWNFISIPIPVGAYSSYSVEHQPSGIIGENQKDKLEINKPNHFLGQLVWFGEDGFFEYTLKNPLPKKNELQGLRLFFEACAETWGYRLDQKTDLSIYINDKKIGEDTITGDFGGKRGKYTPEWWPSANTQYGEPVLIEVRNDGTYIADNYKEEWVKGKVEAPDLNFKKISDVSLKELNLNQDTIKIKIGVDKDAEHKGGMNLFGEMFGNYPKTLTLSFAYRGGKIYQPTISEIINKPDDFEGKTVILKVHPGGWSCPNGKATNIPEGFNRSATMIYDGTGCLYGNGEVLIGKILSPELHLINAPGRETIIIKGKIRVDKNGTPFVSKI